HRAPRQQRSPSLRHGSSSQAGLIGPFFRALRPDRARGRCDLLAGGTCRNAPALSAQILLNDSQKIKCRILPSVSFCSNFADFNELRYPSAGFSRPAALREAIEMLLWMPICI